MSEISKETMFFITWFEKEYPEFVNQFGEVKNFYDHESDEFMIEEIQDAYVSKNTGEDPMPMYFGVSGQFR